MQKIASAKKICKSLRYRGFHEKGTHNYLCTQGRYIVSIERVHTSSTFYMKSALSKLRESSKISPLWYTNLNGTISQKKRLYE